MFPASRRPGTAGHHTQEDRPQLIAAHIGEPGEVRAFQVREHL